MYGFTAMIFCEQDNIVFLQRLITLYCTKQEKMVINYIELYFIGFRQDRIFLLMICSMGLCIVALFY
jgi:hypothetical protein